MNEVCQTVMSTVDDVTALLTIPVIIVAYMCVLHAQVPCRNVRIVALAMVGGKKFQY